MMSKVKFNPIAKTVLTHHHRRGEGKEDIIVIGLNLSPCSDFGEAQKSSFASNIALVQSRDVS